MESSTRMPTASDRPSSVSVLSEKPKMYNGANVAIIEVGIATATIKVPLTGCAGR